MDIQTIEEAKAVTDQRLKEWKITLHEIYAFITHAERVAEQEYQDQLGRYIKEKQG